MTAEWGGSARRARQRFFLKNTAADHLPILFRFFLSAPANVLLRTPANALRTCGGADEDPTTSARQPAAVCMPDCDEAKRPRPLSHSHLTL